jgi:hypothetical protein
MLNRQMHKEINTPTLKDLITTLTLNFHSRLEEEALFHNIGQTSAGDLGYVTMYLYIHIVILYIIIYYILKNNNNFWD